ncbi:MAG TPA: cytochrome c biogenesis protein CcdA [Acidimicrobiia bacterium]|nr:cytochrome c biogenesis protein CcdA [Acidimicrobiia bacterium]
MEIANVNVLAAFIFGILSFISPCVLPLLPGYLSMMSGYSAADLSEGKVSTARMLRVTLLFVAGFTLVFVALGATATTLGRSLLRNNSTITVVSGWVVIFMGLFLAVTAIWRPRSLMPFMRERRADVRPSRLGAFAPPVMGAAFGFAWTPCIGPTLGAILTVAATESTVKQGMVLLFVYSLGLGIPFVLAGIGITKLYGAFGWVKRHFVQISVASGLLLTGFGVLMITGHLTDLNQWFQKVMPSWLWSV